MRRVQLGEPSFRPDETMRFDGAVVLLLDRRGVPAAELARLELADRLLQPVRGVRAHVAIGPARPARRRPVRAPRAADTRRGPQPRGVASISPERPRSRIAARKRVHASSYGFNTSAV